MSTEQSLDINNKKEDYWNKLHECFQNDNFKGISLQIVKIKDMSDVEQSKKLKKHIEETCLGKIKELNDKFSNVYRDSKILFVIFLVSLLGIFVSICNSIWLVLAYVLVIFFNGGCMILIVKDVYIAEYKKKEYAYLLTLMKNIFNE
jgi:hypothetical protein